MDSDTFEGIDDYAVVSGTNLTHCENPFYFWILKIVDLESDEVFTIDIIMYKAEYALWP